MNWGLFLVLQKGSLHQREMQGARSYEMLLLTHSFKPYKKIQAASILQPENAEDEVRLKELKIEKKVTLKGTLIKVWVFIVVALAAVAIEILLQDKDNPNSVGYLLLLIDFNAIMWPAIFLLKDKNKKKSKNLLKMENRYENQEMEYNVLLCMMRICIHTRSSLKMSLES